MDLEYHNFDNPAAPWQDPERAFRLQQPILEATLQILRKAAIAPLILVSGRAFHLVWAVHRDSKAFRRLAGLGYVPPSLQARYTQSCLPDGITVLGWIALTKGLLLWLASAVTCSMFVIIAVKSRWSIRPWWHSAIGTLVRAAAQPPRLMLSEHGFATSRVERIPEFQ